MCPGDGISFVMFGVESTTGVVAEYVMLMHYAKNTKPIHILTTSSISHGNEAGGLNHNH